MRNDILNILQLFEHLSLPLELAYLVFSFIKPTEFLIWKPNANQYSDFIKLLKARHRPTTERLWFIHSPVIQEYLEQDWFGTVKVIVENWQNVIDHLDTNLLKCLHEKDPNIFYYGAFISHVCASDLGYLYLPYLSQMVNENVAEKLFENARLDLFESLYDFSYEPLDRFSTLESISFCRNVDSLRYLWELPKSKIRWDAIFINAFKHSNEILVGFILEKKGIPIAFSNVQIQEIVSFEETEWAMEYPEIQRFVNHLFTLQDDRFEFASTDWQDADQESIRKKIHASNINRIDRYYHFVEPKMKRMNFLRDWAVYEYVEALELCKVEEVKWSRWPTPCIAAFLGFAAGYFMNRGNIT